MFPILEQGLIMGIMALGVFISFRVLNMPDLTVDGTFALGGAVTVSAMTIGLPVYISLAAACFISCLAGMATALIHRKLRINVLLAGILVMTMIYSVNLRIMDGPNLPVPKDQVINQMTSFEEESGEDPLADLFAEAGIADVKSADIPAVERRSAGNIFNGAQDGKDLVIICAFCAALVVLLFIFLKTEMGIALRGFGSNPDAIQAFGITKTSMTVFGLGIANTLVGLGGGLFSLYGGFADVSMGQGMIVTGLAIVMVGELFLGKRKFLFGLIAPLIGGIAYQCILAVAMRYGHVIGFKSSDMKLLTALFIISVISLSLLSSGKKRGKFKSNLKSMLKAGGR